jgi:hypothetical protein
MRLYEKKKSGGGFWGGLAAFCALLIFCALAFSDVRSFSGRQGKAALENSIERAIVNCYAIEGAYPESMEYLQENYGISIDPHKYAVDYQVLGSNIKPYFELIEILPEE